MPKHQLCHRFPAKAAMAALLAASSFGSALFAQGHQLYIGANPPGGWDYGGPALPPRFEMAIFDEEGIRNPVPALESLIPATRSSYRAFYDTTINDPNLSPGERRRRIDAHFQGLRAGIVAQRTASYLRFSHRRHARHSCTQGGVGTRRCPSATKCVTIEGTGLVTQRGWMGLIRTNVLPWEDFVPPRGLANYQRSLSRSVDAVNLGLSADGRTFCPPNLRKSSRGFIRDLGYAYFGYSDEFIRTAAERDADTVMSAAVQ